MEIRAAEISAILKDQIAKFDAAADVPSAIYAWRVATA